MGLRLGIMPRIQRLWGRRLVKPILRAWQTGFYSRGKLALGEPLYVHSEFPRDWICLDWKEADYLVDLVKTPELPFKNDSQKIIYSAHLIEHLPEPALATLLQECCRVLEPGGRVRFECPDAEKLVALYRQSDPHMLQYFARFRREVIVEQNGFDKKYLEDHLSLLGEISNYIIPGRSFHMPVYAPREEFDRNLGRLDLEEFARWCISLQSPEQRKSGGHQNVLYFSKLERMFEHAGFTDVVRADFDSTTIPELRLNENSPHAVRAKQYRRFYSLYVEATKPRARPGNGTATPEPGRDGSLRLLRDSQQAEAG